MRKVHAANPETDRLCVTGSSLRPLRPPVSERTRWGTRNVRLFSEDPEVDSSAASFSDASTTSRRGPSRRTDKKVLALNVTTCKSAGVRSGLLRQIHETVEVDDFRRLLDKLVKVGDAGGEIERRDGLLSRAYIDALHRDLNGHMEVLKRLAESHQEDETFKTTTNA